MQKYVICPFFRKDDQNGRRIVCEGITTGSTIEQRFGSEADYRLHLEVFCCDRFRNCEICEILLKNYED